MNNEITVLGQVASALTEEGFSDLLTNANFPGLVVLGATAVPMVIYLVKWMIGLQQQFANIYVEENKKLRDRLDKLEEENSTKDETIIQLKTQVGNLTNQVNSHERTIEYLNNIIDRRKLKE